MTTASVANGSRFLWVFASVLCVAGVVLISLGLIGTSARDNGDLVGVNPGDTISVGEDGMSIWSPTTTTRTEAICTLGEDTMLRPVQEHATTVAQTEFFEVARTSEQLSSGTYVIACDTQDQVYAGPYGPTVASPGLMGVTGLIVGIVVLALGAVCLGLAWAAAGGRTSEEAPPEGPDPGDYTLARRTPLSADPRQQVPAETPAAPTQARPGGLDSPPSGPRYDVPPPS